MLEKKYDDMVFQRKPKFHGQKNGFQLIVLAYTVTDTLFNQNIDIAKT